MADIVVNALIDRAAQYALGKAPTNPSLKIRLFVNNFTVDVNTVIGNLTPCTAPGYADIALPAASWAGSTTGGVASYSIPAVTFTLTGAGSPGQTVYGHCVFDNAIGLLYGLTWGTPFAIPAGGAVIQLAPSWQDQNC
jgi:hypothetical protein